MSDMKPRLVGGFGEINFGKQYRQGNRIYDADAIAVCLTAQPLGNMGGYSSLYVVRRKKSKKDGGTYQRKIVKLVRYIRQRGVTYDMCWHTWICHWIYCS